MHISKFLKRWSLFIFGVSLFFSCGQRSCIDGKLIQMSKSEMMDIFVHRKFPNLDSSTYYNEACQLVHKDSLAIYLRNDGEHIIDFYKDENQVIRVGLIRVASDEDKEFLKSLRDSLAIIGMPKKEEINLINIDCTSVSSLLSDAYHRDQENRSGGEINSEIDKNNLSLVVSVLEKCDKSTFTQKDFSAIWIVLQHTDAFLMKKYLSDLKEAVQQGLLEASKIAMMEDRILMAENKPQLYGSQIYKDGAGKWQVYKIEDPANVDDRRAKVGLGPLKEYLSRWEIEYN